MKSYRNRFFILIATILLGFLIVINISKKDVKGFLNLSSMEYKDAIDERNIIYSCFVSSRLLGMIGDVTLRK